MWWLAHCFLRSAVVENIALIEINNGPFLVKAVNSSFDNGERALNVHSSNIIWDSNHNSKSTKLWQGNDKTKVSKLVKLNS